MQDNEIACAVELEKVGEFECADVTATGTDFLLQIAHDTWSW